MGRAIVDQKLEMEAKRLTSAARFLSPVTHHQHPLWPVHPTAPCDDDERSETFAHMDGWGENADFAARFLSQGELPTQSEIQIPFTVF